MNQLLRSHTLSSFCCDPGPAARNQEAQISQRAQNLFSCLSQQSSNSIEIKSFNQEQRNFFEDSRSKNITQQNNSNSISSNSPKGVGSSEQNNQDKTMSATIQTTDQLLKCNENDISNQTIHLISKPLESQPQSKNICKHQSQKCFRNCQTSHLQEKQSNSRPHSNQNKDTHEEETNPESCICNKDIYFNKENQFQSCCNQIDQKGRPKKQESEEELLKNEDNSQFKIHMDKGQEKSQLNDDQGVGSQQIHNLNFKMNLQQMRRNQLNEFHSETNINCQKNSKSCLQGPEIVDYNYANGTGQAKDDLIDILFQEVNYQEQLLTFSENQLQSQKMEAQDIHQLIEKVKLNNQKIKEMIEILEYCKRFFEEEEDEEYEERGLNVKYQYQKQIIQDTLLQESQKDQEKIQDLKEEILRLTEELDRLHEMNQQQSSKINQLEDQVAQLKAEKETYNQNKDGQFEKENNLKIKRLEATLASLIKKNRTLKEINQKNKNEEQAALFNEEIIQKRLENEFIKGVENGMKELGIIQKQFDEEKQEIKKNKNRQIQVLENKIEDLEGNKLIQLKEQQDQKEQLELLLSQISNKALSVDSNTQNNQNNVLILQSCQDKQKESSTQQRDLNQSKMEFQHIKELKKLRVLYKIKTQEADSLKFQTIQQNNKIIALLENDKNNQEQIKQLEVESVYLPILKGQLEDSQNLCVSLQGKLEQMDNQVSLLDEQILRLEKQLAKKNQKKEQSQNQSNWISPVVQIICNRLMENKNGLTKSIFENVSYFMREIHGFIQEKPTLFLVNAYQKVFESLQAYAETFNSLNMSNINSQNLLEYSPQRNLKTDDFSQLNDILVFYTDIEQHLSKILQIILSLYAEINRQAVHAIN